MTQIQVRVPNGHGLDAHSVLTEEAVAGMVGQEPKLTLDGDWAALGARRAKVTAAELADNGDVLLTYDIPADEPALRAALHLDEPAAFSLAEGPPALPWFDIGYLARERDGNRTTAAQLLETHRMPDVSNPRLIARPAEKD